MGRAEAGGVFPIRVGERLPQAVQDIAISGLEHSFPLKLNAARADKYLTCQARIRVPIAQLARSATRSASSRAVPLQLTQNVICMEVVVL